MKKVLAAIICLLTVVNAMGCDKKYKIDYSGVEFAFTGVNSNEPPKSAKAGEEVVIYFPMVATDTKYSFTIDNEQLNVSGFSWEKGYEIRFIMPAHDVKISYSSRNTMVIEVPEKEQIEIDNRTE